MSGSGGAPALPPPFSGVSSLDLGLLLTQEAFFLACCAAFLPPAASRRIEAGVIAAPPGCAYLI